MSDCASILPARGFAEHPVGLTPKLLSFRQFKNQHSSIVIHQSLPGPLPEARGRRSEVGGRRAQVGGRRSEAQVGGRRSERQVGGRRGGGGGAPSIQKSTIVIHQSSILSGHRAVFSKTPRGPGSPAPMLPARVSMLLAFILQKRCPAGAPPRAPAGTYRPGTIHKPLANFSKDLRHSADGATAAPPRPEGRGSWCEGSGTTVIVPSIARLEVSQDSPDVNGAPFVSTTKVPVNELNPSNNLKVLPKVSGVLLWRPDRRSLSMCSRRT